MSSESRWQTGEFFLDQEAITELPLWVRERMAERVGRAVSAYFAEHPEEYEAFLKEREKQDTP